MIRDVRRMTYIGAGTLFLILGAIGIVVPLLPTTPFWLLTCWFYLRSSRRLYNRFLQNKYVGKYMKGYMEDKAIPLRAKVVSLTVMWTSLVFTSFFTAFALWIKILLVLIGAGVTYHILSYPSSTKE